MSDILTLKSGKVFENIKSNIQNEAVSFEYEGRVLQFKKTEVKSIKIRPVLLRQPVTDREKQEYEEERIRAANALQNTADWEVSNDAKLHIAVIDFAAGEGVTVSEAKIVTEILETQLVKSKFFILTDAETFAKLNVKNVPQENKKIHKFITGTVLRLGKKYFIKGDVLRSTDKRIEFSEKAVAENTDKLVEKSEYFAKKITGGVLEFWDEALTAKEQAKYQNIKYVWRSALVPGLGQWQYGQDKEDRFSKFKGYGIGAAALLLAGNLFHQLQVQDQNEKAYRNSHFLFFLMPHLSASELYMYSLNEHHFRNYESAHSIVVKSAGALAGLYLINIIDSAVQGKSFFNFKNQENSGVFFIPSYNYVLGEKENTYSAGLQYRF